MGVCGLAYMFIFRHSELMGLTMKSEQWDIRRRVQERYHILSTESSRIKQELNAIRDDANKILSFARCIIVEFIHGNDGQCSEANLEPIRNLVAIDDLIYLLTRIRAHERIVINIQRKLADLESVWDTTIWDDDSDCDVVRLE